MSRIAHRIAALTTCLGLAACTTNSAPSGTDSLARPSGSGQSDSGSGANGAHASGSQDGPGSTPPSVCTEPVAVADISGGCAPRLVTPAACTEIDLTEGKTYEFAWTTDGSGCETPWTLFLAGNPATAENTVTVQLSTNTAEGVSKTGGVAYATANDFAQLRTDNGLYHWMVASHYGSHPASAAFTVKK